MSEGAAAELRRGMTREQLRERLFELMAENARVERSQLTEEARLREDLNLDSLDFISVVNEVEHEWGITIADDRANEVKTVGEVVDILWELLA